MLRNPKNKLSTLALSGFFLLLLLSFLALSLMLFYGWSPTTDVNTVHKDIVGYPVPDGAKNIEYDAPTIFNQWRADYCIISYHLDHIDRSALLPNGFSNWVPLTELFVGHRLFTNAQMPHAWIGSQKRGKMFLAMIVDLDHNQVYVIRAYG